MAYDGQRYKCFVSLSTFPVETNFNRKCYRRHTYSGLVLPLCLITILHLCLFVNGQILHQDVRNLPVPVLVTNNGDVGGNHRLVKRLSPIIPRQERETGDLSNASTASIPVGENKPNSTTPKIQNGETSSTTQNVSTGSRTSNATDTEIRGSTRPNVTKDADQKASGSEDEPGIGLPSGLKPDAVLRLFYVFVAVGAIVLIYILIKFLRFKRKRATRKYRILANNDEQEMFPLAADDGDDEEIFNAAEHQSLK